MFDRNKNKQAAVPDRQETRPSPPTASASPGPASSRSEAMIGPSIVIKGTVSGDEDLVIQGRFAYRSGTEVANRLLDLENGPTAILASNDDMAAGAIAAAHHRNIEVPEDLTICGFDDTMLATAIEPEITTIRQPIAEMAHVAVELLEKTIRTVRSGQDCRGFRQTMDFEVVLRDSHAPPRK